MTKAEKYELDGFMKAKRMVTEFLDNRIETLEQRRGDLISTQIREGSIAELLLMKNFIRNFALYRVESIIRKNNERRNNKTSGRKEKNQFEK
jgi:hypothetical protein